MVNPLITLNGLDDAKGVQSAYSGFKMGEDISQAPLRNSLLDAQVQGAELSNQNMRQQMSRADAEFMLKDAAIDAMRIKELAQVDPMRAQVAIADRIKKIVDRGGDPSDTIGVRELLTSGNTDAFNAELDSVISGAQQAGVLRSADKSGKSPSQIDRELDIKEEANNLRRDELGFRKEKDNKISLSPTTQKILDAAQSDAFSSGESAREMELLSKDLSELDIGGGSAVTFSEKMKQVTGSEEAVSDLRRRFRAFRSSRAVDNLPPGVASDKDIELALSGFPGETANNETIQRFLRGQAKLARLDEAYNIYKSELLSKQGDTRGLIKGWREKLQDKEFQSAIFKNIEGIDAVEDTSSIKRSGDFSGMDRQAYEWAKSNPNDPRAAQILQKLGAK